MPPLADDQTRPVSVAAGWTGGMREIADVVAGAIGLIVGLLAVDLGSPWPGHT